MNNLQGDELFDAVIYGGKKMSEIYPSDLTEKYSYILNRTSDIIEINNNKFIVKYFSPFIWISKLENVYDMSLITFTWNHKIKLFNAYFNGKMFGYNEADIYDFYINISNIRGKNLYETHKQGYNNLCKYISQLPEYEIFFNKHYKHYKHY